MFKLYYSNFNLKFEDNFNDDRNFDEETNQKQSYSDLLSVNNERDLRVTLARTIDVCDFIYQKYKAAKESELLYEDHNNIKLTRKEENGKYIDII